MWECARMETECDDTILLAGLCFFPETVKHGVWWKGSLFGIDVIPLLWIRMDESHAYRNVYR